MTSDNANTDGKEAGRMIDLAQAAAWVQELPEVQGIPMAVLPAGMRVVSLERLLPSPMRPRGWSAADDVGSFLRLFEAESKRRLAEQRPALVFVSRLEESATVRAVLDEWGSHNVRLELRLSAEFRAWLRSNDSPQKQRDYCFFLEDQLQAIGEPPAGELLDVVRRFKATTKVRFMSALDLSNGDVKLEFVKDTEAGSVSSKGAVAMPEGLLLRLPVWEGGPAEKVRVRVRYRICEDGQLLLWHVIAGLEPLLRVTLETALEDVYALDEREDVVVANGEAGAEVGEVVS